jgi:NAD(P)-dependent dehydrogenase (short-subunit alcohol dehydrogenase family)
MSQDPGQKYLNNGTTTPQPPCPSFCLTSHPGSNFTPTTHNDTYPFISPAKSNLGGKSVLITGASKGVGKATALSYAAAGMSFIALAARSALSAVAQEVKDAATRAGHAEPTVLTLTLDVTDRSSVDAAATAVASAFNNTLDVLVNNAGYLSCFTDMAASDPDEWWREWDVNVRGVYMVTRAFWPLLLASPLRIVLNLSSLGAVTLTPGSSAYGTTKLAVLRFTEFIAQERGGGDGVCAIAVHPGGVSTELARNLPGEMHGFLVDTPQLAGDTLVWLGSQRREWLTGRYVSANWDMEELEGRKAEVERGDLLKVRMAVNGF